MDLQGKLDELLNSLNRVEKELKEKITEDNEEICPILEELGQEFNDFIYWCFGMPIDCALPNKSVIKLWKKKHPDLVVPRILEVEEDYDCRWSSIFLMMDAYLHYLKEKE